MRPRAIFGSCCRDYGGSGTGNGGGKGKKKKRLELCVVAGKNSQIVDEHQTVQLNNRFMYAYVQRCPLSAQEEAETPHDHACVRCHHFHLFSTLLQPQRAIESAWYARRALREFFGLPPVRDVAIRLKRRAVKPPPEPELLEQDCGDGGDFA